MSVIRIDPVVALTWDVADLLNRHFELMRAQSPEESCHVMTGDALFEAGARVFAARREDEMLGIAALKPLDDHHGEVKSMHTKAEARSAGVGSALMQHIQHEARQMGLTRLSLETGSAEVFAPARRLYERCGFSYCRPFGSYGEDPLSVFMTREI